MSCEEQTDERGSPRELPERAGDSPFAQKPQKGAGALSKSSPGWGPLNLAEEVPCSKAEKPQADASVVLTGLGLRLGLGCATTAPGEAISALLAALGLGLELRVGAMRKSQEDSLFLIACCPVKISL